MPEKSEYGKQYKCNCSDFYKFPVEHEIVFCGTLGGHPASSAGQAPVRPYRIIFLLFVFVYCLLFVVCCLPFAVCRLPFAVCLLPSAVLY